MKRILFIILAQVLLATSAFAQIERGEGVTSFQQDKDSWRRKDDNEVKILSSIENSIGKVGVRNITEAEQIFCYFVEGVSPEYTGYTINGFGVTSYCGNIGNNLKNVVIQTLFGTEESFSSNVEKCVIRPKLMLRFVRGVDYTDVLMSSPCYSLTFYYAGKIKTFNFTPGAEVINTYIKEFSTAPVPFVSPSLLGQTLPIGVAMNSKDKEKIKEKGATSPVRGWEAEQSKTAEPEKKSGWNNLAM